LHKTYKGQKLVVHVGESTFEFNGTTYSTLSAVAKAISGSHVNGFTFFGLKGKKERAQ
jgi:phosphotransferase system IIA component